MLVKRFSLFPLLVLAVLVYAGCEDSSLVATEGDTSATLRSAQEGTFFSDLTPQAVEGEYIVVFKETMAPGEVGARAREIATANGGAVLFTYTHVLKGFAATLPAAALNAVSTDADVAYVEQSQVVYGNSIAVGGTQSPAPWHLDRIDQRDRTLDNTYNFNYTGAGVTVYIIDSGMDLNHPEFDGRASLGADLVDMTNGGEDCNGHGTHVAGLVGSETFGVAKDVTLKAVRVFDCNNAGTVSLVIAGLDTTVAMASPPTASAAPSVVNLSMVGIASNALQSAVQNTIGAGLSVVASAGDVNSDACPFAPANVADALTVAATTQTDNRTATSNYGPCIDLFAPGQNIMSTWLNGGTNTASGTSQAAPLVAGVAALYLEAEPGAPPALVALSVNEIILSHATAGKVGNIPSGSNTPNFLLFSDVPNNPRLFALSLDDRTINGNNKGVATLSWAPGDVAANDVDFYVDETPDGSPYKTVPNDGLATLKFNDPVFSGPFDILACEAGSTLFCSNVVSANFFYFKLKLKNVFINQHGEGVARMNWNTSLISKSKVDFYRGTVSPIPDGSNYQARTENDGVFKFRFPHPENGPFMIRACEKNSAMICSDEVVADFSNAPFEFETCPECDDAASE